MRVLLSAYACDPTRGSEPGCGWNWVYHTARLGHDVWCITRSSNRDSIEAWLAKHPLPNVRMVYVSTFWWLERLRLHYHQLMVYPHYLVWQYQIYRIAKKMHRTKRFDVTHHVSYGSLQLGSYLWKLDIPFIFGPVGGGQKIPPPLKQYLVKGQLEERMRSAVSYLLLHVFGHTKKTIQQAQLVLATNQETYRLAEQLGARRVELQLDNGIADDFFPATFPIRTEKEKDRMDVLWIGRLVAAKGLSLVIDAMHQVDPQYPIHLTVVGDGPLAHHYRDQVTQLGLDSRITFMDRVPFQQIKSLYRDSDVLLYTGLRNTFGIQLLEAMSFGLPVVTLNLHGVRTFVPDNVGVKVNLSHGQQTAYDIQQALMMLYVDQDRRCTLGRNAYHYAKQHTWSVKVAKVVRAYRSSWQPAVD